MLNNKIDVIKKKNELRENVIAYIYSQELENKKLDFKQAFENGLYNDMEIKFICKIAKRYDLYKKLIASFFNSDWEWERVDTLTRSVLIYGTFEMSFVDKALVIDILIKYAKEFIPGDAYKFINSILQKIGEYYETIKNSKKTN